MLISLPCAPPAGAIGASLVVRNHPFEGGAERDLSKAYVQLKGARPDAIKAIDATKPYKGGDDALWRLHHLNNIDKHRLLLTVGSALRSVDFEPITRLITGFAKSAPLYIKPADRKFPLKVRDRLYAGIYEGMSFRLDVALGEPQIVEGESLLETVQHMADAVDGLIGGFKPLLV